MPTLVHISCSPWSERARFALVAAGVPVARRACTPTLGEPWLRWTAGQWRGPVTVPELLRDDAPALRDSIYTTHRRASS